MDAITRKLQRRVSMTIDEVIKRYNDNAEYERTHGSLQGCLEFRQLAEWLKDYKRLKEQESCDVPDTNDGKMSENPTGSESEVRNETL
jgi:hypothetical protein